MVASPRVIAPGVYTQERDLSTYIRQLTDTIIAVVTTASKGKFDQRVLTTTPTELDNKFGLASELHPGLLVARNFLEQGGVTALVVRVGKDAVASEVEIDCIDGSKQTLVAIEKGTYFDNMRFAVSYSNQESQTKAAAPALIATASQNFTVTMTHAPIVPGTVEFKIANATVATDANKDGTLVFTAQGTTYSGTVNYNTGVISITAADIGAPVTLDVDVDCSYYSAFTLQFLWDLKNEAGVVQQTKTFATYYALTLDTVVETLADSAYIEAPETWAKFPVAGVYQMSGGDDGLTGLTDAHFIGNTIGGIPTGLQLFKADQEDVNEVFIPGRTSAAIRQALIELAEERQDCMTPLDTPSNLDVQGAVDWANATGVFSSYGVVNSNRASIYYPHYTAPSPYTDDVLSMPPTAALAEVLARTDWWMAPAGPEQGLLRNCLQTDRELSIGDRQYLSAHRINPIGNLNGLGIQILGQQTATLTASSLDRVNARRALLRIEKAVSTAMYKMLMKGNEPELWLETESLIQPYLNSLAAQKRIYEGRIYCNEITNTKELVNNNTMSAVVILSLLKVAERIVITFQTVSYGTKITEELLSRNIVGL